MRVLPRTYFGNPILRKRSRDVAANFARTVAGKRLIAQMFYTMRRANGVGLAAPQIGKGVRLAVIELYPTSLRRDLAKAEKVVVVNPKITWRSKEKAYDWEGCLSFPGVRGRVPRAKRIKVRYIDSEGQPVTAELSGFPARVFQHEIDHLDGVVYVDHIDDMKTLMTTGEFVKRILKT